MSNEQEHIGYRKPPKHTQFKKGQSGNPKGRPKAIDQEPRHTLALLEKHQKEKVSIIENGKQKMVSKQEAVIMQLLNHAMAGDLKALHAYLRICLLAEDKGLHSLPKGVTKADVNSAAELRKMNPEELDAEIMRINREMPIEFTLEPFKNFFDALLARGMCVQEILEKLGISRALKETGA